MVTKAQQEQAARLAALHLTWRDPKRTHPERVETFTKEWTTKKGEARAKKLDYVGHANLRDILCYADPLWTWQHGGYDANGHRVPLIDRDGQGRARGIWIDLTVYGVTKPGYGTVAADVDVMNAMKELIGDALRNAAQSFGIAVALWARIELAELEAHYGQDAELHGAREGDAAPPAAPTPDEPAAAQANGNGQDAVKAPLTPDRPPDPDPTPAAEPAETAAVDQLAGAALTEALGKRLIAMRGAQAIAFAAEKKARGWPHDMDAMPDDKKREVLAWIMGQPVERVV